MEEPNSPLALLVCLNSAGALRSSACYHAEPTLTLQMDFQKSLMTAESSLRGVTEQEQTLTMGLHFHEHINSQCWFITMEFHAVSLLPLYLLQDQGSEF